MAGAIIKTEAYRIICKHCIEVNGYCQYHWQCPLLTEIENYIPDANKISKSETSKWYLTKTLAICPRCGTIYKISDLFDIAFANYCPYCGEYMKESEDE